MSTMPYRRPSTATAKWDPSVCTHDNAQCFEVLDHLRPHGEFSMVATYNTRVVCPDCDSMFTVEEFDRLCNDIYMRAAAEARYFDYGYWELYGHLSKLHTQPPSSEQQ